MIDFLPVRIQLGSDLKKFHSTYGAIDLNGATRVEHGILYGDEFNHHLIEGIAEVIIPMMQNEQDLDALLEMDYQYLCRMACIESNPNTSRDEEAVLALLHLVRQAWAILSPVRDTLTTDAYQGVICGFDDYIARLTPCD